MADTNMYMTLTYVDSKRLRCATLGCKNTCPTGKYVGGLLTPSKGEQFMIETYICDECHEALTNPPYSIAQEHERPIVQKITKGCDCGACRIARAIREGA